jgi:hypothetical protein
VNNSQITYGEITIGTNFDKREPVVPIVDRSVIGVKIAKASSRPRCDDSVVETLLGMLRGLVEVPAYRVDLASEE